MVGAPLPRQHTYHRWDQLPRNQLVRARRWDDSRKHTRGVPQHSTLIKVISSQAPQCASRSGQVAVRASLTPAHFSREYLDGIQPLYRLWRFPAGCEGADEADRGGGSKLAERQLSKIRPPKPTFRLRPDRAPSGCKGGHLGGPKADLGRICFPTSASCHKRPCCGRRHPRSSRSRAARGAALFA